MSYVDITCLPSLKALMFARSPLILRRFGTICSYYLSFIVEIFLRIVIAEIC
jgi:hypothetical protein